MCCAEIVCLVRGTPANFNRFRVLAALLHGTVVVGVSQTLRRWTEGATYIRQGGHHAGHWPTFLVVSVCACVLVTPSTKSTKFGRLIERALLYVTTQLGELWLRESPGVQKY